MTERILLPQLITDFEYAKLKLEGLLENIEIPAFPTGVRNLQIILFDVLVSDLYDVDSSNNYICTTEILAERGLTPNVAYEQAMQNLEALPNELKTAPSGLAQVISSSPRKGTDIYTSVRCFSKPIVDKLLDTTEKRYIAFPNLNVPFIFNASFTEEMAQMAASEVFSNEDALHLTPRVYVLKNGVVRDI